MWLEFRRVLFRSMGAFLLMPLLILLLKPLIFTILIHNPQYAEAQDFVFNISVGAAFGGMYYTVANYIFYEKKTYLLAIITFISALLSVGLNLFLIPRYGTIGASYSYMIVNVYIFIAVWILANKVFPMPWFYFLKRKKIN